MDSLPAELQQFHVDHSLYANQAKINVEYLDRLVITFFGSELARQNRTVVTQLLIDSQLSPPEQEFFVSLLDADMETLIDHITGKTIDISSFSFYTS